MKKMAFAIVSALFVFILAGSSRDFALANDEVPTPLVATPTIEPVPTDVSGTGAGFIVSEEFPDTRESKEIIRAIEKSYDVEVKGDYTFDFSKFPDVFINDPRFPVTPGTLQTIRELTHDPSWETAGWLDYKTVYYSWVSNSILFEEGLYAKAKAGKRELTKEERKSLIDPQGRMAPARSQSPIRKIAIIYLTLEIKDDVAVVTLRRGIYHSQLTLVLVDKRWYVANETFLSVSP